MQGTKETKDLDGTWVNTKLEYIAIYMDEMNIDVYLIQETWLEGNIDHWEMKGITFFTHGPETQNSKRGRGGVAIGLLKQAKKAWIRGGQNDIYRHGVMNNMTRIMAIDLRVPAGKSFEYKTRAHCTLHG